MTPLAPGDRFSYLGRAYCVVHVDCAEKRLILELQAPRGGPIGQVAGPEPCPKNDVSTEGGQGDVGLGGAVVVGSEGSDRPVAPPVAAARLPLLEEATVLYVQDGDRVLRCRVTELVEDGGGRWLRAWFYTESLVFVGSYPPGRSEA